MAKDWFDEVIARGKLDGLRYGTVSCLKRTRPIDTYQEDTSGLATITVAGREVTTVRCLDVLAHSIRDWRQRPGGWRARAGRKLEHVVWETKSHVSQYRAYLYSMTLCKVSLRYC